MMVKALLLMMVRERVMMYAGPGACKGAALARGAGHDHHTAKNNALRGNDQAGHVSTSTSLTELLS